MCKMSRFAHWMTLFAVAATLIFTLPARANTWPLPPAGSKLGGENRFHIVENDGGSLEAIAKKYDVGFLALLQANPGIDPFVPRAGSVVTIPLQTLLPDVPRRGIVINLAELRLYYYPPGKNEVTIYPIGIGQQGLETPVSVTRISQKIPNPTWTPTAGIRARSLERGVELPKVVPAGPNNPLGRFAMRLGIGNGEYLIHGTNAQDSVGLRVSSGCIRMNAPDIEALFAQVAAGTRVAIINEPVKYAVEPDGKHYIEVHRPLAQTVEQDTQTQPIVFSPALGAMIEQSGGDHSMIEKALSRRAGYPVVITAGKATSAATPVLSVQNSIKPTGNVEGQSEVVMQ